MKGNGGSRLEFPRRQLFIICVCRFAEPICFTVLFPFIVSMVRDFKVADNEHQIGYYVGFITSSFAVSQLVTGIPWGMLSDRIGRRPVILFGLLGTITSILLFGLSKSYLWALVSRSLCGLLNGNISVLKSMVSELTMNHSASDRARAFSLLPLMYGLGTIIGPVLGGFLSHPVTNFPAIFGRGGLVTDLLIEFPYFLPCLISALICAFGFVFGFLFLEETLADPYAEHVPDNHPQEETRLLSDSSSYNTFHDSSSSRHEEHTKRPTPPTLRESLTPAVIAISLTYGLFAYQAIFYDELFPIWTASQRDAGGLGFTANEIGMALAFSGVVTLVSQLVLLPPLTQRFGFVRLFRAVLFILIFLYALQGNVRYLDAISSVGGFSSKTWVWGGLLVCLAIKTICHTIAFTGCTILINNAAPRMDALGAVNGFSQCCASGMRTFGPASCGMIWSAALDATSIPYWIRIQTTYLILTCVGAVTFWSSKRLNPRDYESAHAREEEVEVS